MAKRRCKARTKKGKPCRAWALEGHLVCLAHADEKTRDTARFGGRQEGAGRPRKVKPSDVERQLLESNAIAWMNPYWQALGFELRFADDDSLQLVPLEEGGAMIYGESKEGIIKMTEHPDLGARMSAAEKLRDRVYGRPRQTTEITGPGGGRIEVDVQESTVDDVKEAFLNSPGLKDLAGVDARELIPDGSQN